MEDELADLLEQQEADRGDIALVASEHILTTIAGMGRESHLFGTASLEERGYTVEALEALRLIELAASSRRMVMEQDIIRAGAELGAKEMKFDQGAVRLETPSPGYDTQDKSLRDALVQLIPLGDVTRDEVDAAAPELIIVKPDHRKLNGLLKRGGRVQEAIESHRKLRELPPTAAKVKINRKGGAR